MRRREFIRVVGGAVATWPVVARAQERVRRIGVISGAADEPIMRGARCRFPAGATAIGLERRPQPSDRLSLG